MCLCSQWLFFSFSSWSFSPSSNCSLPPLLFLLPSASLSSPARKTNCPVVFRACWAITMRWKSQSEIHTQRTAVNLQTARLPRRRNWAPLCLLGTSVASVAVAVARAISGLLSALLQVDLHPSPRNAWHSAAKGATVAVAAAAAAATVVKDTVGRYGRRSQVNTVEVQITQSHTHRVLQRALLVPQAAATWGAPYLLSNTTTRSATAPNPHGKESPTGTHLLGFTPPSRADSTPVRPFLHLLCPNLARCFRSPRHMYGLWMARKRQNPRAHKQKATADSRTAAPWERWSRTARPHYPNSRSPHNL